MDIKQKIKQLPTGPGIYKMKDSLGNIIYVGKAKNLKNRVSQYFQKSKAHSPKIIKMIQNINDFDIMITDTELDAFLTECMYIKEIKPMYNSQMKNDKGYCYIKINMGERYPRISTISEIDNEEAKYYGPYTSLYKVEETITYLKDYFKLRKCTTAISTKRNSGCLNYELGLCLGVCSDPGRSSEYDKAIEGFISFLELNNDGPLLDLQKKMKDAAERFDFEKAARYRDYLSGVKHVMNKQRLIQSSQYDRNVIAIEFFEDSKAKVFFIKGNKMVGKETISFNIEDKSLIEKKFINFITTYFADKNLKTEERLGQKDIDEAQIIYSYLKRNRGSILSFWIPSNWLTKENVRLDTGIAKLVDKVLRCKKEEN